MTARSRGRRRIAVRAIALMLLVGALVMAAALWRELNGESDTRNAPGVAAADLIARGDYLARIGNCQGCHTAQGGAAYAGGRGILTPFGTVYASNLTPDVATGIGAWSGEAFWRALHHGRSRDGRLLYPAFPYPNTTHVSRTDSDALHAYLRNLPPVSQPNQAHALRFPYSTQAALAVWRLLYFRPAAEGLPPSSADPALARGAYLVSGLGHCGACHAPRNALGATGDTLDLDGGVMPVQNWYAPSLRSSAEAGVADWNVADIVALLRTGVSARGSVQGPMAEVVHGSTQYLNDADADAMARFLKSLAPRPLRPAANSEVANSAALRQIGEKLYGDRCANCHGPRGEGVPGAYPALANNRAVLMDPPINLVQVIVHGGFPPVTAGNPRPYGMPPYGLELTHADIAALLTYLRSAWGNQAGPVSALAVQRWRDGGRD